MELTVAKVYQISFPCLIAYRIKCLCPSVATLCLQSFSLSEYDVFVYSLMHSIHVIPFSEDNLRKEIFYA